MAGKATAPYNFIPLPKTVLPASFFDKDSKLAIKDQFVSHVKAKGDLSGVIELDIETRTPFFIGAGKQEQFFSPTGGGPVIPGSTMRGMVKNILKILTCGAIRPSMRKDIESKEIEGDGDFFDHKLYFRGMAYAKGTGVREAYDDELSPEGADGRQHYAAKAGYLIRCTDKKYYICPAEYQVKDDAGFGPKIYWQKNGCAECYSGRMPGKKHHTRHYNPRWDEKYPVDDAVIAAYFDDSTRKGFDLLNDKSVKKGEAAQKFTGNPDIVFVVPCFYVQRDDKIQHFGFGRYYRIPYRKSIGDHVSKKLWDARNAQDERIPDFADALFGKKEDWGSRLFFEDCVSVKDTIHPLASSFSRILATPNPTSFQLYLEQKGGALKTWKDDAQIRGYKLYWHQKNDDSAWKSDKGLKGATPIRPIKRGAKFYGRIRFERLSPIELGALLKVFELAEDKEVCFKLGRGKSIGMGSVRIDAALRLIDKSAYTQLFGDSGWNRGETDVQPIKKYTSQFDDYLNKKLDEKELARYHISQSSLSVMLDWKNTERNGWTERETRMMQMNDRDKPFAKRFILPTVEQMFPDRVKP